MRLVYFLFSVLVFNTVIAQNLSKLDSMIQSLDHETSVEKIVKNNIEIARLCSKSGNSELGLRHGFFGLKLATKFPKEDYSAKANMYIGANYIIKSFLDSAEYYYHNALKAYQNLGDSVGVSNVYNNLGLIVYMRSDYIGALEFYLKSLKLKEEYNDSLKISWNYNSIGAIYLDLNNFVLAEEYFLKGISKTNPEKSTYNYLMLKGNLAGVYRQTDRLNEAMNVYKYIIGTSLKKGYDVITAETYHKLGIIYYKNNGNYSQGLSYFNKAIEIFE